MRFFFLPTPLPPFFFLLPICSHPCFRSLAVLPFPLTFKRTLSVFSIPDNIHNAQLDGWWNKQRRQFTSMRKKRVKKVAKLRKKKWNERIIMCLSRSVPSSFQLDSFTLIGVRFYCFVETERVKMFIWCFSHSFLLLLVPNAQFFFFFFFVRPTTCGGLACFMSFKWWAASRGHTRTWNIITAG